MRVQLTVAAELDGVTTLSGTLPAHPGSVALTYRTQTGATLRLDGLIAGSFDREHDDVIVPPCECDRAIALDVERHSLPTNGLPSGDGLRWQVMLRNARRKPQRFIECNECREPVPANSGGDATLWGHSHLDVAWLWPYSQTRRKAVRTFANAVALAETNPPFVFMQSQPQLYEFVRGEAPDLDARVNALVREGRFDPDVAAMWVEPDANLPSGESLLMQLLHASRYVNERFGVTPGIAWLPDTFGFPNTLPTLLAHAGVPYFATTKLQWNDTNAFAHEQFRWRGPDGSEVISAMFASYEGAPSAPRIELAQTRREPVVVGYGDGGGGPTREHLAQAAGAGQWERPRAWFERLAPPALPVHDDELYLEYHRGCYTTHHDVKAQNASFERRLMQAQERLAWCIAVRAQPEIVARLRAAIDDVWRDVLCNQFHDVLAGACVREAYVEVDAVYERASATLALVERSASAMLPRGRPASVADSCAPTLRADDDAVLDNGLVHAVFDARGALREIRTGRGRSIVSQGNLLAAYRDRPRKWDAWNLDSGYERRRVTVKPAGMERRDDGVEFRFIAGRSPVTMFVELRRGEPFVRVTCGVDWRESHVILRMENWLAIEADCVTYGAPHGTIVRSARMKTSQERAKFEVPGQRFASVGDERGGLAVFALDTYGWSARTLARGGLALGHSLLRSPSWPDPQCDRGEATLAWAFAPFDGGVGVGAIERAWERFACEPQVRLFESDDDAVLVVAAKPAADGDGIIVRVRECDGAQRPVGLRCGARMRAVEPVDGLERPLARAEPAAIEGERIVTSISPFALRSFRVRF